jgi:hypothetical protein
MVAWGGAQQVTLCFFCALLCPAINGDVTGDDCTNLVLARMSPWSEGMHGGLLVPCEAWCPALRAVRRSAASRGYTVRTGSVCRAFVSCNG